jgi:hypothetical protein
LSQYGQPVSGLKCQRTASRKYAGGSSIGSVRGKSMREKSVSRARDLSSGMPPLSAAVGTGASDRPSIRGIWLMIRVERKMSRPAAWVIMDVRHACGRASNFVNHRVTSGVWR